MQFGDVVGLLIAVGGMLGFMGIITASYHRRLVHKERIAELAAGTMQAPAGAPSAPGEHVARLEARVRVLERIATDKRGELAQQIEDLRSERAD